MKNKNLYGPQPLEKIKREPGSGGYCFGPNFLSGRTENITFLEDQLWTKFGSVSHFDRYLELDLELEMGKRMHNRRD